MVLHWLAEGLDVREIVRRVRMVMPAAIEAGGKIAGGAESLSLNRPSNAYPSSMTQPSAADSKGNSSASP